MNTNLQINRYLPVAFLYFFFNGLFLPVGLFYTSILCPLFIIWILKQKKGGLLIWFFVAATPYLCIHLLNGVVFKSYFTSFALLFTVYVFCVCYYLFLTSSNSVQTIFKQLTIWNFLFTLIALLLFAAGVANDIWYEASISTGVELVFRLKMFTTEASVYALMLAPLALYYLLKVLLYRERNTFLILFMILIPLILTISFGVIMGLLLSIVFVYISDIKLLFVKKKFTRYLLVWVLIGFALLLFFIYFMPDNIIFKRIVNVFEGNDSSFKGRTTDSFYLGYMIADMKSVLFGAGPGQIKELGMALFTDFYKNYFTKELITIPNVTGETIAIFGLAGLLLRFIVIIWLFFKTKVFNNYYRLALFIFIFIYQFTGSYITNIPEYLIWITAFTPGFPEFSKKVIHSQNRFSSENNQTEAA